LFSERENLVALVSSVSEGTALKFAHFEKKLACLAPPSGVIPQRTPSFRLISIHRRTLSHYYRNQNSHSTGFCWMGDQICKKTKKIAPRRFWPKM